jgi:hypothetical protein
MSPTTQASPIQLLDPDQVQQFCEKLVAFLETGTPADEAFHPDLFCDLSLPQWRVQTDTLAAMVHLRHTSHPDPGRVGRWSSEPTRSGFVFEFEERWTDASGESWYAREMLRATVREGRISELSIYCTGDWDRAHQDEHAHAVQLVRP